MSWTLKHLIGDYEEGNLVSGDTSSLPISVKTLKGWTIQEKPNRYTRVFKFSDETKFNSFIMDILELQSETQHHARMTIQYPKIKIDVWTHTLDEVTDVDKEWCEKASDIYGDYNYVK